MDIYIILVFLVLSGFFSGIEIAYVTANKLRMEMIKHRSTISGRILNSIAHSPSRFLGTTLIGNNIALIVLSIMMAKVLKPILMNQLPQEVNTEFSIMMVQTLFTTLIVLIFSEFMPKALFRIYPDQLLRVFAIPLGLVYFLLTPFVSVVVYITKATLKLAGIKYTESKPVFSVIDLGHFIQQFVGKEEVEELNTAIVARALDLTNVKSRECMVPRTEIEAIDVRASIEDLRQRFVETGLSRLVVFDMSIDSILGYVHHFDLLKKPKSIKEILFPIKVIPESMPAKEVLNLFIKDSKTIAWVVDEFGGTAGIVTMEDVLEEIFGEIQDEHDVEELVEKQISNDEYIFAGRLEVDYLNEKYELELPIGEYETLAGLIVASYEDIPEKGEEIIVGGFKMKILNVSETRIETVKVLTYDGGK